jgi:hypothetical protein
MKRIFTSMVFIGLLSWICPTVFGSEFGLGENSLSEFRAIKYENIYTKVPTTGKLVSIKIADNGRTYYICREAAGYVIYHMEVRPIDGYKEKIEKELREKGRQWNLVHPDELLFTRERYNYDLKKTLHKYSEAVWVRNEIVVQDPAAGQPKQ